uniref:Uncharacterized protein n=3 Tax=Amphimedon queenslandica TaxID=400682 RepID=A0A1X7T5K8_AMPQE
AIIVFPIREIEIEVVFDEVVFDEAVDSVEEVDDELIDLRGVEEECDELLNEVRNVEVGCDELLNEVRSVEVECDELLNEVRSVEVGSIELLNEVRSVEVGCIELLNEVSSVEVECTDDINEELNELIVELLNEARGVEEYKCNELLNEVRSVEVGCDELLNEVRNVDVECDELLNEVRSAEVECIDDMNEELNELIAVSEGDKLLIEARGVEEYKCNELLNEVRSVEVDFNTTVDDGIKLLKKLKGIEIMVVVSEGDKLLIEARGVEEYKCNELLNEVRSVEVDFNTIVDDGIELLEELKGIEIMVVVSEGDKLLIEARGVMVDTTVGIRIDELLDVRRGTEVEFNIRVDELFNVADDEIEDDELLNGVRSVKEDVDTSVGEIIKLLDARVGIEVESNTLVDDRMNEVDNEINALREVEVELGTTCIVGEIGELLDIGRGIEVGFDIVVNRVDEDNEEGNVRRDVDEIFVVLNVRVEVVEKVDTFCVNSLDVIVCRNEDEIVDDASISE